VVRIEIVRSELDTLQRLGLLGTGDRDSGTVANAVARFVAAMSAWQQLGMRSTQRRNRALGARPISRAATLMATRNTPSG
jgi:chromosome condensin MukBEF MukE localization factor